MLTLLCIYLIQGLCCIVKGIWKCFTIPFRFTWKFLLIGGLILGVLSFNIVLILFFVIVYAVVMGIRWMIGRGKRSHSGVRTRL